MGNEILVEVSSEEIKVAIIEDRELVEFYSEKVYKGRLVGNIYRGKVQSVLPGMQAAFVDIGHNKNAFLYINDDVVSECSPLKQGQEITLQVVKEPSGSKGPRVTTRITLPGRYIVLMPRAEYIGISRKIDSELEKDRLKAIAEAIKPDGMGIIMRTVAEDKSQEEIESDVNLLTKLWEKIQAKEAVGNTPRCLHMDYNLIYRTVRDFFTSNIDRFIINNTEQYSEILEYIDIVSPLLKNRVELFDKSKSLFDYYQIDFRLSKDLARKVWIKCGGYIIIDKTEALTVVDVNTGKHVGKNNFEDTIVETNIEAAIEIAKQLRLRDIGGIIIIDFIDMSDEEHKKLIINTLKEALKKDRAKTTVVGMTGLGLIEMTRKRLGAD